MRVSKPRKLDHEKLGDYYKANPDASLKECGAHFQVSHVPVFHALRKLGITRKKNRKFTRSGTRSKGGGLRRK